MTEIEWWQAIATVLLFVTATFLGLFIRERDERKLYWRRWNDADARAEWYRKRLNETTKET